MEIDFNLLGQRTEWRQTFELVNFRVPNLDIRLRKKYSDWKKRESQMLMISNERRKEMIVQQKAKLHSFQYPWPGLPLHIQLKENTHLQVVNVFKVIGTVSTT